MTSAGGPDNGLADQRLAAALHAPGNRAELLAALLDARVFAAITATSTAEHVEAVTGLRAESSAELAVVLLEAPDGTRALPVFSDLGALRRWQREARPVPLTGAQACAAARDEGATTVLLDPGGVAVAVTELETLAQGRVPVPGSGLSARRGDTVLAALDAPASEELVADLRRALAPEALLAARLLQGPAGLVLGIAAAAPLTPGALAGLAQRLVTRLGPDLPASGLDLAQVGAEGPGQDVLGRPAPTFATTVLAPRRRWRVGG